MCLCLQHKKQGIRQMRNHNNSERVKILTVSKNFFPLLQLEYRKSPQIKCNSVYFSTLLVLTQNKNKASNSIQFEIPRYHIHHMRNCLFFFFLAFIASPITPHTQSPSMDCALVHIPLHFLVLPAASPRSRQRPTADAKVLTDLR